MLEIETCINEAMYEPVLWTYYEWPLYFSFFSQSNDLYD